MVDGSHQFTVARLYELLDNMFAYERNLYEEAEDFSVEQIHKYLQTLCPNPTATVGYIHAYFQQQFLDHSAITTTVLGDIAIILLNLRQGWQIECDALLAAAVSEDLAVDEGVINTKKNDGVQPPPVAPEKSAFEPEEDEQQQKD